VNTPEPAPGPSLTKPESPQDKNKEVGGGNERFARVKKNSAKTGFTPVGSLAPEAGRARVQRRIKELTNPGNDKGLRESAERGYELFARKFQARDGLGPTFNEASCIDCHGVPGALGRGDSSQSTVVLGPGRQLAAGNQEKALAEIAIFAHKNRIPGAEPQKIPEVMKHLGTRRPPSLRGLGWIEGVPVAQITDGGYCNSPVPSPKKVCGWTRLKAGRGMGSPRFGVKMVTATIDEFVASAFFFEMGLTTPVPGMDSDNDLVPDPEITASQIVDVANYIALSEPPAAGPDDSVGLGLFKQIGCADCHWADFEVGGRAVPQFYSDLLAHDLGPAIAETDYDEHTPGGHFRSMPLWGLRDHPGPFLTGGGGKTIDEAIQKHGGAAASARGRFQALSEEKRARLLAFLKNL